MILVLEYETIHYAEESEKRIVFQENSLGQFYGSSFL